MKKNTLLFIAYTICLTSFAQVSFELPLYFEDGQGNRDTIIIGADPNGDWNNNQASLFGEYEDLSLIDTVLDVRLIKTWTSELIKKAIVEEDDDCFIPRADMPRIWLFAKYPPLKVHYDYSIIENNFCYPDRVVFWYNNDNLLADPLPIYQPPVIDCLTTLNTLTLNWNEVTDGYGLGSSAYYFNQNGDSLRLFGTQLIDSPYQGTWPWWDTCGEIVSLENMDEEQISIVNPVSNILKIKTDKFIESIELFNSSGILVLNDAFTNYHQIDISQFTSGIYMLRIKFKNKYQTFKIAKQ